MALNTNKTTTSAISETMQTYYDKKLLLNAKPKLVHYEYGQQVTLPKNSGKTIQFRKWTPFGALTTPLVEGTVPDGQSLEMTDVTAEIQQYGGYVAVSDLLDLTALDPVINDSVELMGDQGGLTVDTLVKNELHTATNVQYANGKLTRNTLSFEGEQRDLLTVDEVRKAVRTLKKNKAPQFVRNGKSHYIAIVGPETTYDLQSDPLWQDVSKYANAEQIFDGEIGKLFGVVFVETSEPMVFHAESLSAQNRTLTASQISGNVITISETITAEDAQALAGRMILVGDKKLKVVSADATAKTITVENASGMTISSNTVVYPGEAGAAGKDVMSTLVFGKNAYGVIDVEGGNLKSIIKPKGSAGTSDPLDQISTIGWKMAGFAAKVLQPLWMVRIEHMFTE